MGDTAVIYGVINGAMAEASGRWQRFYEHNRLVIDRLPQSDDHPPLVREMFSISPVMWQAQPIHFGWSTNHFGEYWPAWREKFEALLHRLCWWNARLHIETDVSGSLSCQWRINPDSIRHWRSSDPPVLENAWEYSDAGDWIDAHR